MPPKKGKKGKKGKKETNTGPQPVTTVQIIQDRTKMLCPRLGDVYSRALNVEGILEDVVDHYLDKAVENQSESLSLVSMKMKRLPDISAQAPQLQCLLDLNLSKNNLFNGDELFLALGALEHLTHLNLSENFLNGSLSEHAGKLDQLQTLNMDVNNVTMLCPAVSNWSKLKVFTISDNSLSGLPLEAAQWSQLTVLNLKNNKVIDVGSLPSSWPQLERIYLGSNLLQSIPFEIGTCTKLVEIDLSSNQIQTLPLSLANCEELQRLHLGNNKIEYIPPEIFSQLGKLTQLHLYKNKIQQLPPEIGNLTSLQKLTLSSNNLKGLPDEIAACTTLEELYVNNNAKFSYFPGTAGHLRKLKELSLAKCPALKSLPVTTSEMVELKELDLRAAKKQVCKITPEMVNALKDRYCKVRGGVIKKAKGGGKKAK
mmetsp:Transcript_27625/g.46358  ORF Transcript_27625/g.46358 Transcript_27625/m.46358 type:complete len:426 (+) Transcript_27625:116-1393(+)|eukprot:CAMPEP_0174987698 /NCGR_PEP_ID=MMETSP0004_2-20121128/19698_1 /TAXON_ID=420556 /ORGANISM="Ochromonas sp., Strain CCMP1393" /LENGTH=425 /DNA_ID=CAMNT_0016240799 /DNA_START=39 /DNA_END=1316 /DNA_ORIENTATION=+